MSAGAPGRCPRCGRELQRGALEGLCPACLMRQALASESGAPASEGGDGSVLFTASLSASDWTLVTLIADDEECVTYLAHPREQDGDTNTADAARAAPASPGVRAARLAQLVVRKQQVPASSQADAR